MSRTFKNNLCDECWEKAQKEKSNQKNHEKNRQVLDKFFITSAIMEFFSFDSHRYMCRDCQDANKEPFDHNKFMDDKKSEALNIN